MSYKQESKIENLEPDEPTSRFKRVRGCILRVFLCRRLYFVIMDA